MASTASLRKMLGLEDEEAVNAPAPGYLESVGVRKMDPAVVNEPRAYEPALPVPPSATPSGENIPGLEDRVYFTPDPEGGRPSSRALATLGGTPAAPGPAPRPGGPLAGRGKTAPISAPPTYESLAALAPGSATDAPAQPSPGGNPTTVNGLVGRMIAGAGLAPGSGAPAPTVVDAARRLLEARQASAGNRLIAGMAQAGATAIGKGDAPGLRQLAANAEVPIQEAEKDVARMDRRTEGDARTKAAVEAAKRALAAQGLGERRQTEMERHNRAMEAKRGGSSASQERADKRLESDVQKAGKDLEPNAQMKADLETVIGAAKESDIPGVGVIAGRLPDWLLSAEGVQTRQAAQRLMNGILRATSGAAVTPSEAERQLAARGMGPGATEQSFRLGLQALAKEAQSAMARTQAKYRPEVLGELEARGGVLARDMPTYQAGGTAAGNGMVRVQAPNGKVKLVPAAQVDAAVAAGGRVVQ